METPDREVNFCYRCGKHLSRQALKCWFCSAPVKRIIRPPRRCPFCESVVGRRAVKCHHCGEFLDGRQFPQAAPQPNITFVIDKAVIGPQGQVSLPPDAQMRPADPQLPMAPHPQIGTNDPFMLGRPPEEQRRIENESPKQIGPGRRNRGLFGRPREERDKHPLARTSPGDPAEVEPASPLANYAGPQLPAAPAQGQAHALSPYAQGQHPLAQALGQQAYPLAQTMTPSPAPEAPSPDDEKYRTCPICETESLATDAFCFHCGQALQKEAKVKPQGSGGPDIRVEHHVSNLGQYLVAAMLFGYVVAARHMPIPEPYNGAIYQAAAAGAGFLLLAWAFFRKRRFFSQFLTIFYAILGGIIVLMA